MRELYEDDPRPEPSRQGRVAGPRLARAFPDAAAPARPAGGVAPDSAFPSGPNRQLDVADERETSLEPVGAREREAGLEPVASMVAEPAADPSTGTLSRLTGAAFDPGRPGLRALAIVAVVVLLGAAALAWWSRPRPEPIVPQLASPVVAAPSPTAPVELVVAVTGQVHQPGLVYLPPGARVADAIEAAGGLLPDAAADHLNLARKVTDGELIAVGVDPPPGESGGSPVGPGSAPGGLVNLNSATVMELQALPGIGPALAQRIVDYRTVHGPFTSVDQLRQVSGIGEVRFAELRELVTV